MEATLFEWVVRRRWWTVLLLVLAAALALSPIARADQEPNDGVTQAEGPLNGGVMYHGTLQDTQGHSDLDTYVFYAAPYQQLDIHVADNDPSSADNCLDVTLGNADNNPLVSDTYDGGGCLSDGQSTDMLYTTGATASRYYIEFSCDTGPSFASDACQTPTQYSVTMSPALAIIGGPATLPPQPTGEPNEHMSQAIGPLAGNVAYSGSIQTVNDEDWFTFITAAGTHQMDIAFADAVSGSDAGSGANCDAPYAEVLDSHGHAAGGSDAPGSLSVPQDSWAHYQFTATGSQRYYVHIDQNGCTGAQYEFIVNPPSALTTAVVAPPPPVHLSSTTALNAFVGWIKRTYPTATGYWICPTAQISASQSACWAEIKVGRLRHFMTATATPKGGAIVLHYKYDHAWRRHFSRFTHRFARGFNQRGQASVNAPVYDWEWLTAGAYNIWVHHQSRRHFRIDAYDGNSAGLGRFVEFSCLRRGRMIACHNALGDAIRYRP